MRFLEFFNSNGRLAVVSFLAILLCGSAAVSAQQTAYADIPSAVPVKAETPPGVPKPVENNDRVADAETDTAVPQTNGWYNPPTPAERRKDYINSVVGPFTIVKNVAKAGFNTARNRPEEWGGTWEGFGRRFASDMAEGAIENTVRFGLDEALKVDSKFYRSRDRSFSAKTRNALLSAVTARNRQGKRVVGIPRLAGNVVANVVAAEAWYPDRFSYKDVLRSSAISVAVDAGVNLVKEFIWK